MVVNQQLTCNSFLSSNLQQNNTNPKSLPSICREAIRGKVVGEEKESAVRATESSGSKSPRYTTYRGRS